MATGRRNALGPHAGAWLAGGQQSEVRSIAPERPRVKGAKGERPSDYFFSFVIRAAMSGSSLTL